MVLKLFTFAALATVVRATIVAQPIAYPVGKSIIDNEYDPNSQYSFSYDVEDSITGDSKSQVETRSGDVVRGQYSLNDPDGTRRTVDYTADPINGFNAVVRKSPLLRAIQPVAATPIIKSVPTGNSNQVITDIVAKVPTPAVPKYDNVAYSAPVPYVTYIAPVAHKAVDNVVQSPIVYSNAYPYVYSPYSFPYVKAHYY